MAAQHARRPARADQLAQRRRRRAARRGRRSGRRRGRRFPSSRRSRPRGRSACAASSPAAARPTGTGGKSGGIGASGRRPRAWKNLMLIASAAGPLAPLARRLGVAGAQFRSHAASRPSRVPPSRRPSIPALAAHAHARRGSSARTDEDVVWRASGRAAAGAVQVAAGAVRRASSIGLFVRHAAGRLHPGAADAGRSHDSTSGRPGRAAGVSPGAAGGRDRRARRSRGGGRAAGRSSGCVPHEYFVSPDELAERFESSIRSSRINCGESSRQRRHRRRRHAMPRRHDPACGSISRMEDDVRLRIVELNVQSSRSSSTSRRRSCWAS